MTYKLLDCITNKVIYRSVIHPADILDEPNHRIPDEARDGATTKDEQQNPQGYCEQEELPEVVKMQTPGFS